MILFDGESVRVRSGTCDGFASELNFRYKQLVTLVWMLRTEKKRVKLVGNPCFAVNKTFKSYIVRSRFGAGIVRGLNIP